MDEELLALLEKYKQVCTIVEGPHDREALKHYGFTDVVLFSVPEYRLVEDLESRHVTDVLILTDLDSAGKRKYMQLKRELTRHGIRITDKLRNYLFNHTSLRHIEGLPTYLSRHDSSSR